MVIAFLFGRRGSDSPRLLAGLGLLAVSGFLLGTVGGVGALFANYVSPQIRAYNRISIYLGFFALFGVALFLTWLLEKAGRWGLAGRLTASAFCLLLLAGGIWDQTSAAFVPAYATAKAACESQLTFVAQIEQVLPPGAMVFQMPFVSFPEVQCVNKCGGYDHFRMYLSSRTLCWSYGAMNGRYGGKVLAQLGSKPLDAQVEQVVAMGYSGIHLDRRGYVDDGRAVEYQLRTLLGVEPLVSADGRDVFFNLLPYSEQVRSRYSEAEWDQRQEWYRSPVEALSAQGPTGSSRMATAGVAARPRSPWSTRCRRHEPSPSASTLWLLRPKPSHT